MFFLLQSLNKSKNVYVIAGQARWDVAAKRPKAIWMTHTKTTFTILAIVRCTRAHTYSSYWRHLLASELKTQNHHFQRYYDNMRLIKQNIIEKDGSGTATLLPEEPEDMVSQSVSRRCSANDGH